MEMIPVFFPIHRNHPSSLTSSFVVMETKPSGRDAMEHPGVVGASQTWGCGIPGWVYTTHSVWDRRAAGSALLLWSLSSVEPSPQLISSSSQA